MKMKMKRKDLDQINDEFSDFSLSSPARKIRRLVLFLNLFTLVSILPMELVVKL